VSATYTFDANGNLTSKTGTPETALRWNSQIQDADTDLYYLRALYYDPVTAQFIAAFARITWVG
jgi:RHS repeat-associated protein